MTQALRPCGMRPGSNASTVQPAHAAALCTMLCGVALLAERTPLSCANVQGTSPRGVVSSIYEPQQAKHTGSQVTVHGFLSIRACRGSAAGKAALAVGGRGTGAGSKTLAASGRRSLRGERA